MGDRSWEPLPLQTLNRNPKHVEGRAVCFECCLLHYPRNPKGNFPLAWRIEPQGNWAASTCNSSRELPPRRLLPVDPPELNPLLSTPLLTSMHSLELHICFSLNWWEIPWRTLMLAKELSLKTAIGWGWCWEQLAIDCTEEVIDWGRGCCCYYHGLMK